MDDLDRKIREAYNLDPVDTRDLERSIHAEIRRHALRRNMLRFASVAALIVTIAGGYWIARPSPQPRIYRDAAQDHNAEVVRNLPRHWRTADSELDALAARFGLTRQRIAFSGYRLLHAKICLLDGQRVLHVVYAGDGNSEYSLFLLADNKHVPVRETRIGGEEIQSFNANQRTGIVVSDAPSADCRRFTKTAALAAL